MTTEYEKDMDAQPVAWVAADTLNSPHPRCVSSLAYMSQLDKDRGREYVPLYAAPVAAQNAEIVRDAERYRLLRRKVRLAGGEFHIRNLDPRYIAQDSAVELDAAIDQALGKEDGNG